MLQSQTDPSSNATELLGLYLSDRKEHLEKEILPALKQGKVVLCDRYKYSTIVYQSVQGLPIQHLIDLHLGMKVPDLALIFDLDANIALHRINNSALRKGTEKFEKKEFLQKAREAFLLLETLLPQENIKIIDASLPKNKVLEQIKKHIEAL
jgi:dTMP kinase